MTTDDLTPEAVKAGRLLLEVRCRRRGHRMGAVHALADGRLVVITYYDSGRRTRRSETGPVATIKSVTTRLWLLEAEPEMGERQMRCDCTEERFSCARARRLIAAGRQQMVVGSP